MSTGEIYIYNTSNDYARFDTLRLEDGKFYYGGVIDEVTPYTIVFPNALEQVIFIGPGEEIEYEAVSNDLNNYIVKGSDENKQMNAFRASVANGSYSDIQAAARSFISEQSETVVSLYIFQHYFLNNSQTTYKELLEVLELLRENHADDSEFKRFEAKVKSMKVINVGDVFLDLKMPLEENKTKNLWSSDNVSQTMFLCWATWLPSSYDLMTRVRQFSRECPKDKMRFVAFSIDGEYSRWKSMTNQDSINSIEHYCDTRAFSSPLVRKLGLTDLPTYYIINKEKKVVAKGSDVDALVKDLDKYTK